MNCLFSYNILWIPLHVYAPWLVLGSQYTNLDSVTSCSDSQLDTVGTQHNSYSISHLLGTVTTLTLAAQLPCCQQLSMMTIPSPFSHYVVTCLVGDWWNRSFPVYTSRLLWPATWVPRCSTAVDVIIYCSLEKLLKVFALCTVPPFAEGLDLAALWRKTFPNGSIMARFLLLKTTDLAIGEYIVI